MVLNYIGSLVDTIINTVSNSPLSDNAKKTINGILGGSMTIKKAVAGNDRYSRSIRGRADKFVLQFPLAFSSSLTADTLESLRNQLEIERAGEMVLSLGNEPIIRYDPTSSQFLSDIHTNINLTESSIKDIEMINEELLAEYNEKFETKSINEMTIPKRLLEATNPDETDGPFVDLDIDADGKYVDGNGKEVVLSKGIIDTHMSNKGIPGSQGGKQQGGQGRPGNRVTMDNDKLKEMNRTTPIIITTPVKLLIPMVDKSTGKQGIVNGDRQFTKEDTVIKFGVKVVTHVLDSEDIVKYLSMKSKRANLLTQFVRLTTGEIKFVRDILMRADENKYLAQRGRNKNVWRSLNTVSDIERMNSYHKAMGTGVKNNVDIIPTTSLAITMDEVYAIKQRTGIDLTREMPAVKKIYSDLFLLELLIVDEMNDRLYKYMPTSKDFDIYKLSAIEGGRITDGQKKAMEAKDILAKLKR